MVLNRFLERAHPNAQYRFVTLARLVSQSEISISQQPGGLKECLLDHARRAAKNRGGGGLRKQVFVQVPVPTLNVKDVL